ncbi:uncharacterized protein LOC126784191 [Argentina anserina]|uniref:uncharacterized protein LOC126784191 n=1 Tax=Argentina anserina TaxID=57926 RepID=UPI002176782F|nr:uncharacterized protein LOC126784191 [Potentilla anserina]
MYKEDDVNKAKAVKKMLIEERLWDQIDFIVAFMGPIYEMIRMTDLDRPCLHLVYEWWDVMIEKVRNAIYKPEFASVLAEKDVEVHNRVPPHRDPELNNERRKCLQKLFPDSQVRNKVMEEFAYFSLNMRDYSTPEALENKFHFEPIIWWASYGASTPLLQTLALKLLNQPCSSSCCERNWSTYSFIYGLKRNKLEPKRAQDLVYIHTNLRLLARRDPNYYKNKDTMWDLAGDGHESLVEENVDMLELATLSLDEPALEMVIFNDEMES